MEIRAITTYWYVVSDVLATRRINDTFVMTSRFFQGNVCVCSSVLTVSSYSLTAHHAAACTCPGESHPGPVRSDGSYVGRSAPEIDVFEALIDPDGGKVCTSLRIMILDCVERVRRCLCQPNGLHIMSVLSTYQFGTEYMF
jgi:hypothetical protein